MLDVQRVAGCATAAIIAPYDLDVIECSTPEKWDAMYSPVQLESTLGRIRECGHYANEFLDALEKIPSPAMFARLEESAQRIERALEAAYRGSVEHGSFHRRCAGEYVPSVFLTLKNLNSAIEALKPTPEKPGKIGESLGLSGNILCVPNK